MKRKNYEPVEYNAAVKAAGQPLISRMSAPQADGDRRVVLAYNENLPDEEDEDDEGLTIRRYEGCWIYRPPEQIAVEGFDLRTTQSPIHIYKRDFSYSTVFLSPEKPLFLELGVAQETIKPGAVGRVQIAGATPAKIYTWRITDDSKHYPLGTYDPNDPPFCGLRRDGIFSPYQFSPMSARMIARNIKKDYLYAEAQILEQPESGLIFFDYGMIVLPIFLAY